MKNQTLSFRQTIRTLINDKTTRLAILLWIAGIVLVIFLSDNIPFDRPIIEDTSTLTNVLIAQGILFYGILLIFVAYLLTRKRTYVNVEERFPDAKIRQVKNETLGLIIWGALALGLGKGVFDLGLHLHGSIFGVQDQYSIDTQEIFTWVTYNFTMFALIPYVAFRYLGYSNYQFFLVSQNRKNDLLIILAYLAIQLPIDFLYTNFALVEYSADQLAIAIPFYFFIHFFGTALPIMIYLQSLLLPRIYLLSKSYIQTIMFSGLAYASLHLFEYWTNYQTLKTAIISVVFVFLQFFGPGLVKGYLTMRTGNAWVHVWAYHVITPHLSSDTPHLIDLLDI